MELFPDPLPPCPECGWAPDVHDDRGQPYEEHERLDHYDIIGADEGNVFCPDCGTEFPLNGSIFDDYPLQSKKP